MKPLALLESFGARSLPRLKVCKQALCWPRKLLADSEKPPSRQILTLKGHISSFLTVTVMVGLCDRVRRFLPTVPFQIQSYGSKRLISVDEVINIHRALPLTHPYPDHDLIKCDKAEQGKMGSDLDSAHASIGAVFWQVLSHSSPGNL